MSVPVGFQRRALIAWLAGGIAGAILLLVWLDYRATREWRRSSTLLAERRTDEAADLLTTALTRDMRGVQRSVLATLHRDDLRFAAPFDLANLLARAFARYPYPESFFGWTAPADRSSVVFFNRSARPPAWVAASGETRRFPVVLVRDPPIARDIVMRIRSSARQRRRYVLFERPLGGAPYQIVVRLFYRDALREQFAGAFGFTVNLDWVRRRYFPELTRQIGRIDNADRSLDLELLDERAQAVAGSASRGGRLSRERRFPLLFFDPVIATLDPPADLPIRQWTVRATAGADSALEAALRSSHYTLIATACAALTLGAGLVLTVNAIRASADLADMKSEFVSTVTHELKTPIATIRVLAETLSRRRVLDSRAQQDYALLMTQEAKQLTRLIDNLLAYARITEVANVYTFERLSVDELLEASLRGFRTQIAEQGVEIEMEIPLALPEVRADRTAMALVLDNLIDNAIRYSREGRLIRFHAQCLDGSVQLEVADRGDGIPADELKHVSRKFFRGRYSGSGGSGLGLAIANRIVRDHGGRMTITSTPGEGTRVGLTLPIAER